MHAIVAASGGMDSTSLLLHCLARGHTVTAISFYYGQNHSLELTRLKLNVQIIKDKGLSIRHSVFNLSAMMSEFHSGLTGGMDIPEGYYEQDNMKQTVVPNRNAIFSSLIYGYALSIASQTKRKTLMALGVHSGDHAIYPDCRPEFYQSLYEAFLKGNWDGDQVELYLPYINGDKVTILQDCMESCRHLALSFRQMMENTCTSYAPDEKGLSSGKTGSDVERILAFHELGMKDPVGYVDGWESALEYALTAQRQHNSIG